MVKTYHLDLTFIKEKGEDKLEIIIIKIDIKEHIAQAAVIGECYTEVELSTDKSIEEGHNTIKI